MAFPSAVPHTARPTSLPSISQSFPPSISNSLAFQWPQPPTADAGMRLSPPAAQTKAFQHLYSSISNPSHFPWLASPASQTSVRLPPLAAQAHTSHLHSSFLPHTSPVFPPQVPEDDLSVRLPPPTIAALAFNSFSSLLQTKSQYSLFTATPMPIPSNAIASEPPSVTHYIRAQILAGADMDLSSLLSLLPGYSKSNHQIDWGDFLVTLKNSSPHSSRILSFPEL